MDLPFYACLFIVNQIVRFIILIDKGYDINI